MAASKLYAKKSPVAPGNQPPAHAPHTKPGRIKPTGSPAAMRRTESVTSTAALKGGQASRVYPNLKAIGTEE
jgi:hypothetical protein